MSNLISMWDFKINDQKLKDKSLVVKKALQNMRNNKQYTTDKDAKIIDFFEFLLNCQEANAELEKRIGNKNARRV